MRKIYALISMVLVLGLLFGTQIQAVSSQVTGQGVTAEGVTAELTVTTDKSGYELGETVYATATVTYGGGAAPGIAVALQTRIGGKDIPLVPDQQGGLTNDNGQVTVQFRLESTAEYTITPGSTYTIYAAASDLSARTDFTVAEAGNESGAPAAGLLVVGQNASPQADTVAGSSGAVAGGAEVRIYSDASLNSLIASVYADAQGGFGPVDIGDNEWPVIWVAAIESGKGMSQAVQVTNDIVAPAIAEFVVTPLENVGNTRPVSVTAATYDDEVVTWTVEWLRPSGSLAAARFTGEGANVTRSWTPAVSTASGTYKVRVKATDTAGNTALREQEFAVYNYPLQVIAARIINMDGQYQADFLPGQFYMTEVTFKNLGPQVVKPLAIAQTVRKLESGTSLLSLGAVSIELADQEEITLTVGAMAPSIPGNYTGQVLAWSDWPARAGTSFAVLAPVTELPLLVVSN